LDLADPLQMRAPLPKKVYVSHMSTFDYTASAELFAAKGRSGLRYRRFARAAEAIRYALEKLPPKVFLGTSLEVNDGGAGHCGYMGSICQDIHAVGAGSIVLMSPTAHTSKERVHALEQWRR
jgi:hypothetical protein